MSAPETADMENRVERLAAAMLCERIEKRLTPEKIAAMEREAIQQRIGRLTFDEARVRLRCANNDELLKVLNARCIPFIKESQKRRFVLIADIEAADRRQRIVPDTTTPVRVDTDQVVPPAHQHAA